MRALSTIVLKLVARDEVHPTMRWLMTDTPRRTDTSEAALLLLPRFPLIVLRMQNDLAHRLAACEHF